MITTTKPGATKRVLEFIPKHKATLDSITPLAEKRGQKGSVPAVDIALTVKVSNKSLDMLSPSLRTFLFHNSGRNTGDLAAVDPVSDLPNLTPEAVAIGDIDWAYEQTGCTFVAYEGNSKHVLKDCTVRKPKISPQEGGTVAISFHVYKADVDEETMGFLGVLKAQERDIELTAPELVSAQKTLGDDEGQLGTGGEGNPATPLQALQKASGSDKADKGAANASSARKRA